MLLKEMNFRDIVDKYLYIDAAGVVQNLGSIFEVTDDVTGLLCYGYIDAQAGISFEILCCAVYDTAKKTLKLLHGNGEQSAKIRLSELLEAQAAVLPSEMPRLSEFQSKVAMVQVREVNIIGTLLSEPQKVSGLHKGDEISFFLVRNEKGIMCMKVLEG